jgi:hypothetical protein
VIIYENINFICVSFVFLDIFFTVQLRVAAGNKVTKTTLKTAGFYYASELRGDKFSKA